MGIHGIYKEIGPGRRVALSKLSAEHYVAHNRPFRLAIDISIWLFQIQSGKGGTNPALRTFYYRLLRLLSLNIHPLFVFDGPNKPLFKRNKRVGGPGVKVSSIPEFLAKQLLKHFGFPLHYAPGEAEAECALLQREGIVDAVLSEDVDTLMFGSGMTLKSWTPEMKSSKTPTHVNVYHAHKTKETSGLDREGMVLVAMMSGGDYIPEGIPGCGPKLACEAAKAGFGKDLCCLKKNDQGGIKRWREELIHEMRTNESKFFSRKRTALEIPPDFPNMDVLTYYTHPVISGQDKLQKLRDTLKWDMPLDYPSLRDFAKDAFDWRCIGGAKKFIRNLAPAVLVRELRMRGEAPDDHTATIEAREALEAALVTAIHSKRNHVTTDGELELRISFVPIDMVNIDLSVEDPDDELPEDEDADDSDPPLSQSAPGGDGTDDCPPSPTKKRGPSQYDPTVPEKVWILDTFVRLGVPLKVQDYEETLLNPRKKAAAKNAARAAKPRKNTARAVMQQGAIERFTTATKIGIDREPSRKTNTIDSIDLSGCHDLVNVVQQASSIVKAAQAQTTKKTKQVSIGQFGRVTKFGVDRQQQKQTDLEAVDLSASSADMSPILRDSSANMPRNKTAVDELDLSKQYDRPRRKRPSPEPVSPLVASGTAARSPRRKFQKPVEVIDLLSSSPMQAPPGRLITPPRAELRNIFRRDQDPCLEAWDVGIVPLPDSVTRRRKRSPLKRHKTAPALGEESSIVSQISRPSTPEYHDTVDAMDLAARSPTPMARRDDRAMRAAEIQSQSGKPPATIHEWIRRSVSVTPTRVRHANFVPATLASPKLLPQLEESEDEADAIVAPRRVEVSATSLLPISKYYRDRSPSLTDNILPDARSVDPAASVLGSTAADYTCEIPMPHKSTRAKSKGKSKTYIQPRESLPGAWKEVAIESVDLTGRSPHSHGYRTRFRRSEVEMLDLTGDD